MPISGSGSGWFDCLTDVPCLDQAQFWGGLILNYVPCLNQAQFYGGLILNYVPCLDQAQF